MLTTKQVLAHDLKPAHEYLVDAAKHLEHALCNSRVMSEAGAIKKDLTQLHLLCAESILRYMKLPFPPIFEQNYTSILLAFLDSFQTFLFANVLVIQLRTSSR